VTNRLGFRWLVGSFAAWLVLLARPSETRGEFETPVALTGVKIVTDGTIIESGAIVMAEGRIVAVGGEETIPPHAERVDGAGLIAYPGFIDAQCHLGIPEKERTKEERERTEDMSPDPREGALAATRFAERRGVRPQFRAIEAYAPDDKQREAHRASGFTVALIAPRDGLFAGTSDLVSLSNAPIRRVALRAEVAHHGSFTVGEQGEYPRTILGIFAQFRQVLLDARWHARMQKYTERHPTSGERVPTDAALDSLQPLLAGTRRIFFEANTENEIRRALDLAAEFKLSIVITGGKEAWKVADRLKAEQVPVILSLKFDEEPEYGKKKKGKPDPNKPDDADKPVTASDPPTPEKAETEPKQKEPEKEKETEKEKAKEKKEEKIYEPLRLRQERRRLWDEQVANAKRLHETGVPFAFSTRKFKSPSEFVESLRMVIEKGLPEAAALRALTSGAAEILRVDEQLGKVAPGYVADVTVMTKPLSDKKAKVKFAFIDGKKIEIDADDDKDKEKGGKDDKPESKDDDSKTAESDKPAGPSVPDVAEEDKGPKWEVELLADRMPKTKTGGNAVIRNAIIIPVVGDTIPNGSILIRNGKIAAVGANVTAPEGFAAIDANGRYVIPGIVDPHSHLGIDGVNESPLAISAEVRIADTIDPHDVAIYRALAGGATTHHAMHGSANPIGGQNVVFKLKYERPVSETVMNSPRTIKFALGENVTQTNFFENFGKRYPNTRMGVEAVIRTAFEAAKEYQREWDEYNRAVQASQDVPPPRRDLRLEALADILAGRLTIHSHCYRSEEILRLLAVAEEYGVRVGLLHHVLEGYRIAPEIARHGCGASTFANDWAYKVEAYQAIPHNAALMTENGVNSSVNSDSQNTIRYLGQEAAKTMKWGGLDENQALRLVTLNPAMQLQVDDRIGSIEVGKDADLAIFNGHPLNTFSKCVMTLVDGEVYFEDDRPEPVEPLSDWKPVPVVANRAIPATPHRAYAIVNATVHPISGPVIEKGKVVIVEDKILAVGADAEVPPGAGVIDGTGLHVYPGLIDAGSVLGLTEIDSLRTTRDFSEIGTFNPHLKTASAIHPHSEHIRIARAAGITTALVKPSGSRIQGQSAVVHLDGWTAPQMLLVDAFGLHMSVPSLPVHLPEDKEAKKKQQDEHKKALKQLEDYIAKAKHYAEVKKLKSADPKLRFDVDLSLEAMVPYVRGEKPVIFEAATYKPIVETLEFAEKHKLKCILSGGQDAWKVAEKLKEKDIPVILSTVLSYPRNEFEAWDAIYRCAAELDRAGVRYCFASDSASSAYDLGTIAGMAVAHGLPRERAERALTLGAAEILALADRVGSIEPGKYADLIVTTDTPLQTVALVTHVFIDGEPIDLSNMHEENYLKFRSRPAPKLPPAVVELRGPKSLTGKKGDLARRETPGSIGSGSPPAASGRRD